MVLRTVINIHNKDYFITSWTSAHTALYTTHHISYAPIIDNQCTVPSLSPNIYHKMYLVTYLLTNCTRPFPYSSLCIMPFPSDHQLDWYGELAGRHS